MYVCIYTYVYISLKGRRVREVQVHAALILAPNGGKRSALRSGRFTPEVYHPTLESNTIPRLFSLYPRCFTLSRPVNEPTTQNSEIYVPSSHRCVAASGASKHVGHWCIFIRVGLLRLTLSINTPKIHHSKITHHYCDRTDEPSFKYNVDLQLAFHV